MAYIGHSPTNAGTFYILDDITMGSGTTYGLAVGGVSVSPSADNLLITLDGVIQHPTDAYTVSGSNIVFASGPGSGVEFYGIIMGQSASTGQGSIGADELKVSGDGSSGQVLVSDGDGTFSWATDTENYLPLAGGTMSGAINLGSQNVTNGGTITGTFVGNITGNVTGNASGTALTVTQAAQTAITSVGTSLTVGTVADEGDAIITNGADGGRYDVLTVKENGNARWNLSFEGSGATNSLTLNGNATSNVLVLDNATGNATFAGAVTAPSFTANSGTPALLMTETDTNPDSECRIVNGGGNLYIDGDLNDEIADSFIAFRLDNGSEKMRIKANGSIMSAHASGATSNTAFGEDAGIALASGGNYNTLFGHGAGQSITTADQNVLIGYQAGDAIVDGGHFNIAMGTNALGSLTTGDENVAIGDSAGVNMTATSRCVLIGSGAGLDINHADAIGTVAIGYQAGANITSGEYNTAVGFQALLTGTTNNGDTAIGHSALRSLNKAGNSLNTAVGFQAGYNVTSGINNTLIGCNSGLDLTTGGNNVFVGKNSGANGTLAGQNVVIGFDAGSGDNGGTAWEGDYNVVIGHDAGQDMEGNASNHNTYVGFEAGTSSTTGATNTLIGSYAGGTLTTGTNNVLIGYSAGSYDGADITNGTNNVIVGNYNKVSASDATHQIVLGYYVTGDNNNSLTFGNGTTDSAIDFADTTITQPSDERMKEDIKDATAGLSFLNDLRPVTFRWRKKKDISKELQSYEEGNEERFKHDKVEHGFIAQEVKKVIDSHSEIKDGFNMWKMNEGDGRQRLGDAALMPIMVKAIQELSAEIEKLKGN